MEQELIQNKDDFPDTHFFVYKDKRYPIKYHFFKFSSKYFFNNSAIIKKTQDIPLIEEESENKISLSEQSIIDFIKYVQHEPIYLTNENVSEIDFLAKKFEVSSLTELIKKYISSHNDELAIQFLIMYSNDPTISTEEYEEIISEHFLKYIQDKRLFDIQLPILYRIFTKYQEMNGNESLNNQNIVDFLFKCLDKYGRQASILFTNVDFENLPNRLLRDYSKIFDFHFINASFLKNLYINESDLIFKVENEGKKRQKLESEMNIFEKEMNKMREEMRKMKNEFTQQLEDKNKQSEKYFNELKEEINKIKNENNQLKSQNQSYEDQISKMKSEFSKQLEDQNQQLEKKLSEIMQPNCNQKSETLKNETDSILLSNSQSSKNIMNFLYNPKKPNQFVKGILIYLKESILIDSSSKFVCGYGFPRNVIGEGSYFKAENNDKDFWIRFNFKKRSIEITNYYIDSDNIKNWEIQISDDGINWTTIDSHSNYSDSKVKTIFNVPSNRYVHFCRLHQTGEVSSGLTLKLNAIEFYGNIKDS